MKTASRTIYYSYYFTEIVVLKGMSQNVLGRIEEDRNEPVTLEIER
jgi:hypothetical protein